MFDAAQSTTFPSAVRPATGGSLGFDPIARIDFGRIADVLWRRKILIAATIIASLAAMGVFILMVTPLYTAVTEILINPSDLRAFENGLTPTSQASDANNILQVESQARVLTSDSVLRRVVSAERLDQDTEFSGGTSLIRQALVAVLTPLGIDHAVKTADPVLEALTELRKRVGVRRAERTYVVDVNVQTREPEKSVRLANAIAKAYFTELMAANSDGARRVSDSLTARLAELKGRVREAEERVEQFKVRNNILGAGGQLVNERQLTELNNHLMLARARAGEAKSRYDQIVALQKGGIEAGSVPEAVQSQTITALRTQYATAVGQETELMTTLGARHPSVVEIHAQVGRLRQLIREEVGRIAEAVRNDYERAKASEESLSRNLDILKRGAETTNEALVPLRELEREVQTSRAVYESFLTRARETGEQERLDTKNIRVISVADLPQRRSFPPRNLVLFLGALIFGAAAGTGLAFLREAKAGTETMAAAQTLEPAPSFRLLAALPPSAAGRDLQVVAQPQSPFASQIREFDQALRTSHRNKPHQSILIVAAGEDRDAAMVALNLAALSAQRQRVLVIDADSRRPTGSFLKPDLGDAGLIEASKSARPLAEAVARDNLTNINIIPLASARNGERQEFRPDDIRAAFNQTAAFDLVIVTAPMRQGDRTARLFAALTDQTVLVVDALQTREQALANVFTSLGGNESKIVGVVVTNAGDTQPAGPRSVSRFSGPRTA